VIVPVIMPVIMPVIIGTLHRAFRELMCSHVQNLDSSPV
jgi:hypothetical protein